MGRQLYMVHRLLCKKCKFLIISPQYPSDDQDLIIIWKTWIDIRLCHFIPLKPRIFYYAPDIVWKIEIALDGRENSSVIWYRNSDGSTTRSVRMKTGIRISGTSAEELVWTWRSIFLRREVIFMFKHNGGWDIKVLMLLLVLNDLHTLRLQKGGQWDAGEFTLSSFYSKGICR